jgi:hypothetical protein
MTGQSHLVALMVVLEVVWTAALSQIARISVMAVAGRLTSGHALRICYSAANALSRDAKRDEASFSGLDAHFRVFIRPLTVVGVGRRRSRARDGASPRPTSRAGPSPTGRPRFISRRC